MKRLLLLTSFLFLVISQQQCLSQDSSSNDRYTFEKGDYNGTGKWYMGREIAYVMGFEGMSWLERPEREAEENTAVLLRNMGIGVDDDIADIGAGSGYHVFQMAPMAKNGLIYAVDIQEEMLFAIQVRQAESKVENIEVIKGTEKTVNLPENSVDKVLMVDVYHEFSYPFEMVMSMKKALRRDGKIYLIEYRAEDDSVPIKKVHKMSEAQAVKEMKAAGMKLAENIDNLPWQHCMVFVKE